MATTKTASLYRMVMDKHICPYGLKSKYILEKKGYKVNDNFLTSREEVDAFKAKHDVKTTPQTFIGDERIGGYEKLREYFGDKSVNSDKKSYRPVIVLFVITFLMAVGAAANVESQWFSIRTIEWFIAFSMCGLAYLKLRDIESFSTMFLNYDLLARKKVVYSYLYPYGEAIAGLLMIADILPFISIPIALFISTIGAISVFKAVYIDKRELKCACVGGDTNVPLGFISLTENLMMFAMAIWMTIKYFS